MPYFSVIIPVYNRPGEVNDLLKSLSEQTCKDFEVIIVEDGSTVPCKEAVDTYAGQIDINIIIKATKAAACTQLRH